MTAASLSDNQTYSGFAVVGPTGRQSDAGSGQASQRQDAGVDEALCSLNNQLHRARALKRRVELDNASHRLLVESSDLSPLLMFNDLLAAFFRRFRESVKSGGWNEGIDSHQRIIDALYTRKIGEARDELQQHIESHRDRLEVASYEQRSSTSGRL